MKFFHVYNEDSFKGLEKNGFLNRDSGFKIQNVFSVPRERQFNQIAKPGGRLHSLIKENKYPFYVDRMAGGITYYKYNYDKKLLGEYAELLGEWFLGVQMHESASNRRGADWGKLIRATGKKGPYDPHFLDKNLKSPHAVTPDGEVLHDLSIGSIYEYAKLRYAESPWEYLEELRTLYLMRMEEVDGHLLPCDSGMQITWLFNDLGVKSFMPEVGCQIPMMRKEVTLARGVAKAYGKTWGTYYECWCYDRQVKKYTMPCFNNDLSNEWYLTQEIHPDDFTAYGENGGSSRLLQDRIYHYTLMSGADYISEEWGLNCSYTDMHEFTLSSYGQLKKNFISFAESMRGITAKAPFAIVLPTKYYCLEIRDDYVYDAHRPYTYMRSSLSEVDETSIKHIEAVLDLIFGRNEKYYGNEGHTISNSLFGDVFDIIYEDSPLEAMERYEYLIDATQEGNFAKANADKSLRILESSDLEDLKGTLQRLIPEIMPCHVDALCWLVSTDENGRQFLSIFNNEGNTRSYDRGDVVDHDADRTVTVTFKEPVNLKVIREGYAPAEISKKDDLTWVVMVPAASFAILEF